MKLLLQLLHWEFMGGVVGVGWGRAEWRAGQRRVGRVCVQGPPWLPHTNRCRVRLGASSSSQTGSACLTSACRCPSSCPPCCHRRWPGAAAAPLHQNPTRPPPLPPPPPRRRPQPPLLPPPGQSRCCCRPADTGGGEGAGQAQGQGVSVEGQTAKGEQLKSLLPCSVQCSASSRPSGTCAPSAAAAFPASCFALSTANFAPRGGGPAAAAAPPAAAPACAHMGSMQQV